MQQCKWQIMGNWIFSGGKYRIAPGNEWVEFTSIQQFYKELLQRTGVKLRKSEKFFRIGKQSAMTISAALLVLEQLGVHGQIDFDTTAILGYGNAGSHHGNLAYWQDYTANGKAAAQGHLFVGTLASTPLCQLALTLGCHAPVYYVSSAAGTGIAPEELEFIHGECKHVFLIKSEEDFCSCVLLRAAQNGVETEKIVEMLENMR